MKDVSLREHLAAIREADLRFAAERDRRLTEVAVEREKALKIKEQADRDALGLAREIQAYKDEKANELRAQIESERGVYLTREEYTANHVALVEKLETTTRPLTEYVAAQSGPRAITPQSAFAVLAAVGVLAGLYFGTRQHTAIVPVAPVTTTVTVTSP
jgi:hypothetical protein